jgi:hypothetical protein
MGKTTIVTAAAVALAVAAAGCGSSSKSASPGTPRREALQQLRIVTNAHSISALGVERLHAGLVTFHVRDASSLAHGVGVIRLDHGTTPAQAKKVVGGDTIPDKLPFTLLGGVPQLQPGGTWEATLRLTPGRYLLFDDGENGKGMQRTFTVPTAAAVHATPPKTVGTIVMTDFKFGIHVPADWDGKGVLKVPNDGKAIHELTFVKFGSAAELRQFAAILSKGYPKGPPPRDAKIVYAVGGTSPGQTSYVKVDLAPGRYLAVCLFPDAASGKPHTALGMMSTVTVH